MSTSTSSVPGIGETKQQENLQKFVMVLMCGDPAETTHVFFVPADKITDAARRVIQLSWAEEEPLVGEDGNQFDELLDMLQPFQVNLKAGAQFGPSRLIVETLRGQY